MRFKNNCRKATFMIEKRLSGRITLPERIELKMHLAGCKECRLYMQQSQRINKISSDLVRNSANNVIELDELFKYKLKAVINKWMETKEFGNN